MTKLLLTLATLVAAGAALAQAPFVDIPPCHWAAEAVSEIAGQPQVDRASARTSTYLIENSLRQVFEGLKCQDPGWSLNFVQDAPPSFPTERGPSVDEFELTQLQTSLAGDRATVAFTLRLALSTGGASQTFERQGRAELVFSDQHWLVYYTSLASLGLPIFPE